uniref:ATP-binding cassette sub-family B member 6 n=1 Tax=Tigriopus japonicus TaxID=158387 RepID=A0A0A7AS72_TIGJA|nr:ATP-binding cassette transporter sub-family B member 6 [Tigriopus japonicus]
MYYCGPNDSLSNAWVNHGFGLCFLHTLGSSIIGLWILTFGCIQLGFYKKYATRLSAAVLPQNKKFKIQVFSHYALTSLAILSVIVRHAVSHDQLNGYEILDLVANLIIWPLTLTVLLVERNFQLPSAPSNSHGVVLISTWTLAFLWQNLKLLSLNNEPFFYDLSHLREQIELTVFCLEYAFVFSVFFLGMKAPGISQTHDYLYGEHSDVEAILPDGSPRNQDIQPSTWSGLWTKLAVLLPYMWPKKSLGLQFRVFLCFLLLAGVRVANVFVPLYYKKIVDALTPVALGAEVRFCWDLIAIFVTLKLIQGGGTGGQGILNNIRSFLWIRVQQYTTREIQVGLFTHLHHLSLRWHLSRKTGEVLRIMDRGTSSINGLLSYLVFNILPTIVDIVIAIVYFSSAFNIWFGLIVLVTMIIYLAVTVAMTEWRTKFRRSMNQADNEQRSKGVDSLLNFETVKYYGAEPYEIDRYEKAILSYQAEEFKSQTSLTFLNGAQSLIINGGLLAGSLYCALLVTQRYLTPGDYVLFGTYILQLMVPLNFLGTLYRVIQESFINMENMLELMDEPQEISDRPNAMPIMVTQGKIEFKNVNFHYGPDRPILKDISFIANPGETVALVGATGSGKSTIVRLLFRFYDVQSGSILIDDQNIQTVTQASVRKAIGVVPQDTVLFNDTIRYNIRYGRPDATDNEVEDAARHADIHDKIMGFPDGYDTKVGERGLKLSGGEKQRVAIARTILKSPKIVLLDEATSALDTQTERHIQNALQEVSVNRTTIVVAHRLSTITNAHCILVVNEGEIVERGRHEELLGIPNGKYAAMWSQQSQKKEAEKD